MGRHVMMICQDPELVTDLAAALDELDRLTVVESPAAVVDHDGLAVDAVVVDLPAETRRATCDQLRERYPGQLVVPVDDSDEVAGWPPDPARRVLVRPFPAAELVAGLEPDQLSPQLAAEARRQMRQRPLGLTRLSRAEAPDPVDPARPANGAPARPGIGLDQPPAAPERRPIIIRDQPLRSPETVEAAPRRRSRWRAALTAAVAVVLFTAGALLGSGLADWRAGPAAAAATTAPATPPSTVASGAQRPPQACADAMDDAAAAISYLVAKIRDRRLAESLKRYADHARACRVAVG